MPNFPSVFLLLGSIFLPPAVSASEVTAAEVFYIKPTNSFNPDCPQLGTDSWNANRRYCVTLDNFTRYELPHLTENATVKALTLIFLKGTHNSTMPIAFSGLQRLTLVGLNDSHSDGTEPLIQLLSGDVSVLTDNVTPLVRLEVHIKQLKFNGTRKHIVMINTKESVAVSVNQVELFETVLQIAVNGTICPFVSISNAVFTASTIELYGCQHSVQDRNITLLNSTFKVGKKQLYTIAICPSKSANRLYYRSSLNTDRHFEYENAVIQMYNITISKLWSDSVFLLHTVCSSLLSSNHDGFADIYIFKNISFIDMTITESNFNQSYGTAIRSSNCGYSTFKITNSYFKGYTQGVFVFSGDLSDVTIKLINTTLANNSISTEGTKAAGLVIIPTIFLYDGPIVEITDCLFQENNDHVGNLQIILLQGISNIVISNSTFVGNNGTVIGAKDSNITFTGNVVFEKNNAWNGGALSLSSSVMTLHKHTTVEFNGNHAIQFGGALFIDDCSFYIQSDKSTHQFCFYQPSYLDYFNDTKITFYNNTAEKGGYCIYGTSIRNYCRLHYRGNSNAVNTIWKNLFAIDWSSSSLSSISSKAMRVCLCDTNGHPQCTDMSKIFSMYHRQVYAGEEFNISVVVVGAEFGTTIGDVYAKLLPSMNSSSSASLQTSFYLTSTPYCTSLNYSINSTNLFETIYLTSTDITLREYGNVNEIAKSISDFNQSEIIPYSLLTAPVFVNVTLSKGCPRGFTLANNGSFCDCYSELQNRNITCTWKHGEGLVSRSGNNWIGRNDKTNGILFNPLCQTDHCKLDEVLINLDVDNGSESDSQCVFNHAGLLCGGCKDGYSLAIGSSHCINCTNNDNLALVIFFAIAGPLLFVVIAVLDLTIAKGHINGLVFYTNIVWIYQSIVFSDNNINSEPYQSLLYGFKVFIAWLNLDFGIETCFFKGLDAFWKSLLQYVFPLYIWFIAWMVKVIYSHISRSGLHFQDHYPQIVRMMGKPVDVLTTFVFLSYMKVLRTIVAGVAYTTLTSYPRNLQEDIVVWAVDGNFSYFSIKHIIVFIFALLSLIFTSIYTIYIFLAGLQNRLQCGRDGESNCGRLGISWFSFLVDMPLPLRDSHFLPLKNDHRYWFGLLLLVRIVLLVIFSVIYLYPQPNLLVLMITMTTLLFYMGWKKVYNKESVWLLQGISLGNLIFLSGGLLSCTDIHKPIIICISLTVAFVQFLVIVFYPFALCCFKKSKEKSRHSYQPQATDLLPSNGDAGHAEINTREPEGSADNQGFRESLLVLSESEPLIGYSSLDKKRNFFQFFDCCNQKLRSLNNLNNPTYS